MKRNKLLLLLALLMTAATGAWAQDTYKIDAVYTFTANGQSQPEDLSIDDAASLPFTKKLSELDPYSSSWKENSLDATYITVSGDNIEKGTDASWDTEITINGAGTAVVSYAIQVPGFIDVGSATITFTVTKNEAASATYKVTMKDGVKDADKWTVKVGNGEAQALPIGGLKGDGTETVTLQYNGRLKVKGVKATSDAAPAAPATVDLDASTKAWADGSAFAVPAGGLTYSDAVTVSGNVTLTLTAGTTLTLNKGISLASGATLTIDGTGTMVVNGTNESTASTVAGSTGTLVLTSGTLTAKGGNGQSLTINWSMDDWDNITGASGGVAINGNVTVSGGTVTATGGNGGNLNTSAIDGGTNKNHGGNGGAAISGSVTVNGGTWTATDGSNGTYTSASGDFGCSAGTGSKAVAGTVTDNRN